MDIYARYGRLRESYEVALEVFAAVVAGEIPLERVHVDGYALRVDMAPPPVADTTELDEGACVIAELVQQNVGPV